MEIAGVGQAVFWPGGSLWLARIIGTSAWHRHHAIQLCLPLDGAAQLQLAPGGPWIDYAGALIGPDVPHGFRAPGQRVANILFEPESPIGRSLRATIGGEGVRRFLPDDAAALAAPLAEAARLRVDGDELAVLARRTLASLAGAPLAVAPGDARIAAAIDQIRARINEPLRLAQLASAVGLSTERFRHVFVAQTGVGFRAFVLWERLNHALALGFGGHSWTAAAHAAHFADSAHLTRTCRRMLGFAPSAARPEARA